MKKLFVVLLAVLVLGSLALVAVACDDTEDTVTTEEVVTTEAAVDTTEAMASEAISTADAADYEGETITMTGEVVGVVDLGADIGKVLIQLDSAEDGEGGNLALLYADIDASGGALSVDMLQALVGKTVEATGEITINAFEAKPEIAITSADQLIVL